MRRSVFSKADRDSLEQLISSNEYFDSNKTIQWNCRGLRPNFDELTLLVVKNNPLAVLLSDDLTSITISMKLKIEHLGVVSILVNENIPQSIATLNTKLQVVAVKVIAHKSMILWSVYLPPHNHLILIPKTFRI